MSNNRMPYRDFIIYIKRNGFILTRKGKHQVWKRHTGEIITLPVDMRQGDMVVGPVVHRARKVAVENG